MEHYVPGTALPRPTVAPDPAAQRWVGETGTAWRYVTTRDAAGTATGTVAAWRGSVDDLARLTRDTDDWRQRTDSSCTSREGGDGGEFHSHSYEGWLSVADNGYPEGAERVRETAAALRSSLRHATVPGERRGSRRAVAGGRPVVADALAGRADCYRRRRRSRARSGRVVSVAVEAHANCNVTERALFAYTCSALAVVRVLESLGLEVSLTAAYVTECNGGARWYPDHSVALVDIVRAGSVATDSRTAVTACVDTFRRGVFALMESNPTGVTPAYSMFYGRTGDRTKRPEGLLSGFDLTLPDIASHNPGSANDWADPAKAAAFLVENLPEYLTRAGVSLR